MPADDPLDDTTPIFTQADVYYIAAAVAGMLIPDLDPFDVRLVPAIDVAVEAALNR